MSVDDPLGILVSGCLAGTLCAVDGGSYGTWPTVRRIMALPTVRAVGFCPEHVSFGTPRDTCNIVGGDGFDVLRGKARVIAHGGEDWTDGMIAGARQMLAVAVEHRASVAILMDISAACGTRVIYDGHRAQQRHHRGPGVAAALLIEHGIRAISQRDHRALDDLLAELDPAHVVDPALRDYCESEWFLARFVGDIPALEARLFARLDELDVRYELIRHPPVFTVAEARRSRGEIAGVHHVKNLFLRDKKGSMWLVVLAADRDMDLRALRPILGVKGGGPVFASEERLWTRLGVKPGSVTPLAVMHDTEGVVGLFVDEALRSGPIAVHPLHNAATLVLEAEDVWRFCAATGHPPTWLRL